MRTRVLVVVASAVTIAACCVVGWVLTRPDFARPVAVSGRTPQWSNLVAPIAWTATGAVLARVRPGNRVALLLLGVGACQAVSQAAAVYGMYGAGIADPNWPAARWVAEFGAPLWIPGRLPLFGLLLAIYPDGHLPGKAWRAPALATILGMTLLMFSMTGRGAYDDNVPGAPPLELIPPTPVTAVLVTIMAVSFLGGTATI